MRGTTTTGSSLWITCYYSFWRRSRLPLPAMAIPFEADADKPRLRDEQVDLLVAGAPQLRAAPRRAPSSTRTTQTSMIDGAMRRRRNNTRGIGERASRATMASCIIWEEGRWGKLPVACRHLNCFHLIISSISYKQ